MPLVLKLEDACAADLDEAAAGIRELGFDPAEPESLDNATRWLRRLGNNQSFLGDILIEQLAQRHREETACYAYSPQVIMLVPPGGSFFMRANIWPAADDPMVRASGEAAFAIGMPHDHNFSFLTHGYFGPGYWSDYYEYDFTEVCGYRGEPVRSLRFVERARLEPGKIMLYRAHLDVHAQLPADSLSVSLNVMHTAGAQGWLDQYRFDLGRREIAARLSPAPSAAFLKVAVGLDGEEALDLASRFALRHPSDTMRLSAWEALAARETDPAARDGLWREAEGAGSRLVAMEAKARRIALEQT